jgi:hypothetical protein
VTRWRRRFTQERAEQPATVAASKVEGPRCGSLHMLDILVMHGAAGFCAEGANQRTRLRDRIIYSVQSYTVWAGSAQSPEDVG